MLPRKDRRVLCTIFFYFDPRVFCTSGSSTNSLEGVQKFYYGPLEIIFYITGWFGISCAHSCVKGKGSKLSNFVVKDEDLSWAMTCLAVSIPPSSTCIYWQRENRLGIDLSKPYFTHIRKGMRKWCHSTEKGYSLVLIHPVPSNFGPSWIFCRLTTVNPNHSIYESCIGYYYCKNCVVRHDSCESITHLTPSCKKFKTDGKMMSVRPTFFFC